MEQENRSDLNSVSIWLNEAKAGDELAAQRIFERYFSQLVAVSRNRVRRKQRVEDSEDAVIKIMYDFLDGVTHGKYPDIQDRSSLWPFLVKATVNQSRKQIERENAQKRGGGRGRGESVFFELDDGGKGLAEFAVLDDQGEFNLEKIVSEIRAQLDELQLEIFELKLQQLSNRAIAEKLNRPPRTIDRKMKVIHEIIDAMVN